MREYFCYVLLVFIPIGFLMVKILNNYGLATKNIISIVLISLGIIISFPVCMARLGLIYTFTLYIIIMILVVYYIAKTDNIAFDRGDNSTAPSIFEIADNHLELNLPEEKETIQKQQEITTENIIDTPTNDIGELIQSATEDIIQDNPDVIEKSVEIETTTDINLTQETEAAGTTELAEEFVDTNGVGDISESENEIQTEEEIVEAAKEAIIEEDIRENYADNDEEISVELPVELGADSQEVAEESAIIAESIKETLGEGPLKSNEEKDDNNKIKLTNELEQDIILNIEKGFQNKISGNNYIAIDNFLYVWEHTKDIDLKYLVTLEITELCMVEGLYNDALSLLNDFLAKIPSNYINETLEIKKRFDYITLLNEEIIRLGLEVMPLAKLPRSVKMKVADELNQVD
ncbi:MAG: hypothetical protein GX333_09960 [Syntrophomonadaceae bacterium]|nr:hypothetical protein [Syntrophomonadaceae bacterium]